MTYTPLSRIQFYRPAWPSFEDDSARQQPLPWAKQEENGKMSLHDVQDAATTVEPFFHVIIRDVSSERTEPSSTCTQIL